MTLQLHAQPYDLAASGFYFESYDDYAKKAAKAVNDYGDPVEEFETQFIHGEAIDCALAHAIGITQATLKQFFDAVEDWDEDEKTVVILATSECGYTFDDSTQPSDFDLDIYHIDGLRDLAEEFVDEGLFGDIPDRFSCYIDYDAIARDLSMDYSEAIVAGKNLVYRTT